MNETPNTSIAANSLKHWLLFGLAWAEERNHTPISPDSLTEQMGETVFGEYALDATLGSLRHDGFVYKTPMRTTCYSLSEAGKDYLISLGAPSEHPSASTDESLDRDLSLPDAVHDRARVPDTLRIRTEWPQNAHLFREDTTGDLISLCDVPFKGSRIAPEVQSVTPAEVDAHADVGGLCSDCTARRVFIEWREQALQDTDTTSDTGRQSRWEKYQEWINTREFDGVMTPEEALEQGRVLVSRRYTAAPYQRKLHAYRRRTDANGNPSDWFTALCGSATESAHEDSIEPMDPASFVSRSDVCTNCQHHVRESDDYTHDTSKAEALDFDPFGVFGDPDTDLEQPDVGVTDTDSGPVAAHDTADEDEGADEDDADASPVCPDCGRDDFDSEKSLSIHWGHQQTECEYPVPDTHERAVFTGLWLVGGERDGNGTPPMRKTSVNREALEWVNDQLGLWSGSVTVGKSDTAQQANVEAGFDYDDAESQTQYRLTTRACPWLEELAEQDIADIELTPVSARILYSFRGHLIDNSVIAIRHRNGPELADCLDAAGFEVRTINAPDEGKNQFRVRLSASASREFAKWIEAPLPGFENKAFDFRESHTHKEGARNTDTDPETQGAPTVSLEPEWDWVGVQLYKIGLKPLAVRAFTSDFSPAEFYGEGGVQDLIHAAAHATENYGLDLGTPGDRTRTLAKQPVAEEEVGRIRRDLGLDDGSDGTDGNGNGDEAAA